MPNNRRPPKRKEPYGEAVNTARLTVQDVREIWDLRFQSMFEGKIKGARKIARELHLPESAVCHVLNNESWADLRPEWA